MSDITMQEILKRLDTIGAKLGEGAEFAWKASIKQQLINNGFLNLFFAIGLLAICWALVKTLRKVDPENYDANMIKMLGCGFGTAVTFVWGLFVLYDGLVHVINPQYYALMDLARLLGR